MRKGSKIPAFTLFVTIIAAFGGLLFGYHTAVISGALLFLENVFNLSIFEQQIIVSTVLLGALLGAIFGGSLADHFGRRAALFLTSFLFIIGTYLLTSAYSIFELIVGRFITGVGVGLTSLVVPLYIAEMSPSKNRGMLVSFNQFAITIGILSAFLINYGFARESDWRWMFGFAFIPAVLQLIGLFFITDTPSWFISHGKKAKAYDINQYSQLLLSSMNEEETQATGEMAREFAAHFTWDKAVDEYENFFFSVLKKEELNHAK